MNLLRMVLTAILFASPAHAQLFSTTFWKKSTNATACSVAIVGQACPDGTIYAGLSPDGSVPMYTTVCDAHQYWNGSACVSCASGLWSGSGSTCSTTWTTQWNNGSFTSTTTGYTSAVTGKANTTGLAALADGGAPYNAASYCENLNAHGRTDWYLPARNELNIASTNKTAIGNFDLTGSFYFSSTESASNAAWTIRFSDGIHDSNNKGLNYKVRCVRR